MSTKSQIEQTINSAEAQYLDCWEYLSAMKKGDFQESRRMSLIQFQPQLATTLFDLTRCYRKIKQEKNSHVSVKKTYSDKWFRSRMKFLSNQQELLNKAIAVGRGIGDAFALFFYQRDRHYLAEHLAQPAQFHTPPGVGGAGELEFVKRVPLLHGYFVLYHGNTNILRLGDLTLMDLKKFRVAGIGELKSHSVEPGRVHISLLFSGPHIKLNAPRADSREAISRKQVDVKANLPASGRDRLKRQMQRISNSYKKLSAVPKKRLDVGMAGQVHALTEFIGTLKSGKFSYRQFGKSLLLIGYKDSRKTLYKKLSNSGQPAFTAKLVGIEKHASGIMANDRNDNAIVIGTFYYDSDGKTRHTPGMSHLIWWPLSHEAIKRIVFHDVILCTLFNPAHLIASLEKTGFSVEETGRLKYKIFKRREDRKTFVVEGMDYYLAMIQQYLFTEEAIVSLISKAEGQIESLSQGRPLRVELLIEQMFGHGRSR